jgi:hypothetical protein
MSSEPLGTAKNEVNEETNQEQCIDVFELCPAFVAFSPSGLST